MKKIILLLLVISSQYIQAQARWVVDVGGGIPFDLRRIILYNKTNDFRIKKVTTGFPISIKTDIRVGHRFNMGVEFNTSSFSVQKTSYLYNGGNNNTTPPELVTINYSYKRLLLRFLWNNYYKNENFNTYIGFAIGTEYKKTNQYRERNKAAIKFMYGARYLCTSNLGISSEFSFGSAEFLNIGAFYKIK